MKSVIAERLYWAVVVLILVLALVAAPMERALMYGQGTPDWMGSNAAFFLLFGLGPNAVLLAASAVTRLTSLGREASVWWTVGAHAVAVAVTAAWFWWSRRFPLRRRAWMLAGIIALGAVVFAGGMWLTVQLAGAAVMKAAFGRGQW